MRKKLLSLLVLLMVAVTGAWADGLSGEGTAGSPYLIQSDDDWTEFCTNFDTYRTSVVKLTTDVTITTPLGTKDAPFTGTFDGDGHTMNANITDNSGSAAPFRYINGGTIRNLVVTGSVSGSTHTSGLVGFTDGDSNTQNTIENCLVQANVTCSAHFGGLVGHGLNSKVVITGSAFTGNMAIPNKNQYAGGLLGWCGNAIVEITNSIFAGTRSGNGTVTFHPIGIFYGSSSNVTGCSNCYYTIAGTTSEFVRYTGKQAFTITAGENVVSLAVVKGTASTYNVSGITVYENTPGMTYGDTYYVGNGDAVELALTTDNNPDPDHYITNYLLTSGTFNVETSTLTMGNSNAVVSAEYFRPLEGAGTADSPYLIQSDDDWICFCHIFDTYGASVIKLTSNINVTTIAGSNAVPFTGTFDGDGYTMTVNINDNSATYTAPFRYIQGATIRNLVATGSVTSNKNHTAGLVGGVKAGASTIENCLVSVNVNCGVYCGGIVGHGQSSTLTMTGCAYTGTMATSGNYAGGLQGWADNNTLNMTNCIFAGTKTGNATFNPIAIGVGTATGSGNCYYTVAGNNSSNYNGKQAFTITAGDGVTSLAVVKGAASTYSMSGITVYEGTPGMTYGGTYYVGNGDAVVLALTADESIASDPNLQYLSTSGSFDKATSTLTMGNANAVLSAMVLHPLSGEGTTESPYLIQSDDDWTSFCTYFNIYKASVIKLTHDINVTTIAGTSDNPFAGTFDGDGHTLTFNWTATGEYCAPFAYINGATFNNLHVAGTITTSYRRTGGLIGQSFGTSSINNCRSSVEIISSYSGDAIRGGFAAALGGGTLNFNGCIFDGTFTGTSSQTWGGFVGWKYNYTVNVENCLFAPQSVNVSASNSYTFSGNGGTVNNSYYFTNHGTAQGKQACTITAGENVTSVTVVKGAASTYSVSGITVYENTPGMTYGDTYYVGNGDAVELELTTANNPDPDRYITSYQSTSGNFSGTTLTMGNGNAVISATFFRPLDGAGTAESPYLIEEDAGWTEFCTHFDTYKTSVIKLTSNINVTTPVGTRANPFTGTFDGDGYMMNVNINDNSAQGTAPFRSISGATIRNLIVAGSVTSNQNHTSGLVGFTENSTITIENCRVEATINCGTYCGGIVGHGLGSTLTMTGCAFTGTMNTTSNTAGGLQGWGGSNTLNMTNCIFAGTKTGNATFNPIVVGVGTVTGSGNCYYTVAGNSNSNYNGKQAFTITAGEDVTSLAIDGTATTYSVSGITVYEGSQGMKFDDTYYAGNGDAVKLALTIDNPDPDHNIVRYQSTSGTFDSSTSTLTMGSANAVVSVAEIFTPLSGAGTAESPYLIGSDDDWTEFCKHFDNYKAGVINLTGDINVTTVAGTYDKPFTGTFDGMGNTIAVSINDNSAQGTAPFRAIQGATIRNLVATGSVTSTQNHAGGLVGFVRTGASTIENCLVQTNVNCNTYCGGIVGHGQNSTLTMTGCAYTGTMATSGNTAGGLQGWADSNTLIMTNCIFAGTKTGGASFNPIAVNVGTATGSGNCYYTVAGNNSSNYNGKQARTITAGENVTSIGFDGTATTYSVSGITVYEGTLGMKFGEVLYSGNGDDIKLAVTSSITDIPEGYMLFYLSTSGTFRGTTLTMGNADAVVSVEIRIIPTYPVVLADGTVDADSWTINPNPVQEGQHVTATHTGKKKVKSVRFRKALVSNITLNKTETTITVSETETLSVAAVTPDYVTDKSCTWSSDNVSVATVNTSGVVTAVATGTAHIRATANDGSGVYDECTVTVKPIEPTLANTLTHKGMQVRVEHQYVYGATNTNVVANFTSNGDGTYSNSGWDTGSGCALWSYALVLDGENLLYKVCLADMGNYGRFGASYTFYPYDNKYTYWKAGEFDPTITPLISVKVNGTTIDMQDGTPPPPEPTLANTLLRKDLLVTVRYNFSGEAYGTGQSTVTFKSRGDGTFTETGASGNVATNDYNDEELFWQDGKLVFKQNCGGNGEFGYTVTMLPSTNTFIEWKGPRAMGTEWGAWNPSFVGNVTVSNGTESVDIPMSKEPILAKTMTTAGMEVTVRFHYYNENYCTFVSNGNGTYTFKTGQGFAGLPENTSSQALVVENGNLVFKLNYYPDINYWWSWSGYSVTINPNTYTYSQWVSTGNQEGIPCYTAKQFGADFTSLEVDGLQIYLTQQ